MDVPDGNASRNAARRHAYTCVVVCLIAYYYFSDASEGSRPLVVVLCFLLLYILCTFAHANIRDIDHDDDHRIGYMLSCVCV